MAGWETSWNIDDWIRLASKVNQSQAARDDRPRSLLLDHQLVYVQGWCWEEWECWRLNRFQSAHYLLWSTPQLNLSSMFPITLCKGIIDHLCPGFRLLGLFMSWWGNNIDDLIQHIRFCEPPLTWAHFYLLNMFLSFTLLLEALVFRIKNRGSTIRNQRSRIKTYMFNCWHKIHLLIGGCCVLWYPRWFWEKLHLAKAWML